MTANPTLLSMPLAQNGQKNVIPTTQATAGNGLFSQSTGFPAETSLPLGAGGVAPSREDFNGLANLLGGVAFMAQKGFTFNYDATQDYYKGCVVIDPDDGKRYECVADMAAGTVSPHEDTNNDYWKVFSTGGGVAVGFIMPYAGTGLQEGWLDCDGSAVSRTMYPDLFAAIGTTWGAGDGSTTFNLPRSEDLVLQGASATNPVGTYKTAGLPNIEGENTAVWFNQTNTTSGALGIGDSPVYYMQAFNNGSSNWIRPLTFDASDSNAIYGASDTVQPPAACVRFMIKAFDGPTPSSAGIDLTQYAQDLANKADRSLSNLNATGEAKLEDTTESVVYEDGFAIIYPNGGTAANPANVTNNTRYVEANPFPGYVVACKVEILFNNNWGETNFINYASDSVGVTASQLNDDSIIVQCANYAMLYSTSAYQGDPFGRTSSTSQTSAPCRVKVWKIGKVANS